jgi:hypothetical protein
VLRCWGGGSGETAPPCPKVGSCVVVGVVCALVGGTLGEVVNASGGFEKFTLKGVEALLSGHLRTWRGGGAGCAGVIDRCWGVRPAGEWDCAGRCRIEVHACGGCGCGRFNFVGWLLWWLTIVQD